MIPKFT